MTENKLPATLGELKASGRGSRSIKQELQENLIAKIRSGDNAFPGIIGYEDTVLPELENALLAGHDIIFLGERGQGKTRIMRSLVNLLDEWTPVLAGCEINDDPLAPICGHCKKQIAGLGDRAPVSWLHRASRYGEKLATPDVTIADLIGDIDPVKVAEGRHLADEGVIHYGLIPRTNRGIFSVNELPDLHEKIQVGLFNLLEERDVQIRGYKFSLPLDIFIIATANPEDYTSRGRIITPLKDRFGAQVRTHYPRTLSQEVAIMRQEIAPFRQQGLEFEIPGFMEQIVAEISQAARRRQDINHFSGVSVRMTIHNMETLVSNALRRAVRLKERAVVPRITDLPHLSSTMKGKVEWNFAEAAEEDEKLGALVREAVLNVFKYTFQPAAFNDFLRGFTAPCEIMVCELSPVAEYAAVFSRYPALREVARHLAPGGAPAMLAAACEFMLEGLAVSGRIARATSRGHIRYSLPQ
jgi:magnesium chelatase subunit I